ncbi:trigger factor [Candidatus Saccharibacteria bacterium]|jgi:trigger factor|nr:trigger factor [Candidatus Saccharibacteria bacterium]
MHISKKSITPTKIELTVTAEAAELAATKATVLTELGKSLNLAGFRKGHAPQALIEKSVDQGELQSRFLDAVVNELFVGAVAADKLRPVATPEVSVTKFVPFTEVECKYTVDILGEAKLADYKNFSFKKESVSVSDKDVASVIEDLRARSAEKSEVKRAAKNGDEVVIDFVGVDAKSKQDIEGAAGNDFPLVIGSNTFIPGFEPELVGLKADDKKTFTVTFPKDYGAKELQNKKVSFTVTVKKVNEVKLPEVNDEFAVKLGPKTVADLKTDIHAQLVAEKENQAERALESQLLQVLTEKSSLEIPTAMVDEEIERMLAEEKRNLLYRGQTWQEHLDAEGKTEEEHREDQRPQATMRVKSGVLLGEVSQAEGLTVTDEELQTHLAQLKQQYTDPTMQAELAKPENHRDIASRILTEKTIQLLKEYASK